MPSIARSTILILHDGLAVLGGPINLDVRISAGVHAGCLYPGDPRRADRGNKKRQVMDKDFEKWLQDEPAVSGMMRRARSVLHKSGRTRRNEKRNA